MRELLMTGNQLTRSPLPRPNCMKRCAVGRWLYAYFLAMQIVSTAYAQEQRASRIAGDEVLRGLNSFYAKTARANGSFQAGIDPDYLGMSDSANSDLAAVTYACTIHKTFGWRLPFEEKTIEFLVARQKESGEFVNVAGTVDPASPQGRVYNTTQALVALCALGAKPKYEPMPVFEEILRQDYKTLPAYSTSFFPLAYLCYGKPIPDQADRAIRALMIQDEDGYLNDHIAATFHASHYYALVGDPTPKAAQMINRILRDQNANGSWFLNQPAQIGTRRSTRFSRCFTKGTGAPTAGRQSNVPDAGHFRAATPTAALDTFLVRPRTRTPFISRPARW